MTLAAWIWLGLVVAFLAVEGATASLVSVWFAGGAVSAFFAALFGLDIAVQLTLFVLISAALLACLRPLAKKRAVKRPVATNADRVLGRLAVVTEAIDNLKASGTVRVDGMDWTARAAHGEPIRLGQTVKILYISGVKVIVEPLPVTAAAQEG